MQRTTASQPSQGEAVGADQWRKRGNDLPSWPIAPNDRLGDRKPKFKLGHYLAFACRVPWLSPLWLALAGLLLYVVPVRVAYRLDNRRFAVEAPVYPPLAGLDLWGWRRRGSALLRPAGRRMKNIAQ